MKSCAEYLAKYIDGAGGYLEPQSANSTRECLFCTGSETNIFLRGVSADYADRWRNFAIFCIYIIFNVGAAVGLYWLARVPKRRREKQV